jgi:hypothetical protein
MEKPYSAAKLFVYANFTYRNSVSKIEEKPNPRNPVFNIQLF